MSAEIITIRFTRAKSGSNWKGYFIDVIDPPITTVDNVVVVPTPSSGIPQTHIDAQIFTPAELLAFDAGTKSWKPEGERLTDEEDNSAALAAAKVRAKYHRVHRVQDLRDQFRQLGRRIDA